MTRLSNFVHVQDAEHGPAVFGPGDDVPGWAVLLITNPKAWAEPPAPEGESVPAKADKREVWEAHAARIGVDDPAGFKTKDDLIEAVEAKVAAS